MYYNYWSNSKFSNRLRGAVKPFSLSADEWDEWRTLASKKHPIRYWVAEELLDHLQDIWMFIPNQLSKVSYYISNRFIEKRHVLKTKLKPGVWHEFETRLLHGAFEELVDFVEVEKAYHHTAMDGEAREKYKPSFWRRGFLGLYFRGWRCPEAGISHLKWEASLRYSAADGYTPRHPEFGMPTNQAVGADETMELYFWWKNRKYRPDPYEESGINTYYENKSNELSKEKGIKVLPGSFKDFEDKTQWQKLNDECHSLEKKYTLEDTEMLIRLVKLRSSLWT